MQQQKDEYVKVVKLTPEILQDRGYTESWVGLSCTLSKGDIHFWTSQAHYYNSGLTIFHPNIDGRALNYLHEIIAIENKA